MSHRHVQQLRRVEEDFAAIEQAVASALTRASLPGHGRLLTAAQGLETAYVTRLFSEFEALLARHLRSQRPLQRVPRTAEGLIDRVALRHGLPDQTRLDAHKVRAFRNSVVHADGTATSAITLRQAARYLYHYASMLP